MKITTTQYAQSLNEATKDKSHDEIDGVLANFVKVLAKNGDIRKIGGIIGKFKNIYNSENGIVEVQVTSRENLSNELREYLRNKVGIKYGAKEVVLAEKVDESIGGGVVVRVGDEVMDGSIRRKLEELKKELRK